MSSPPTPALSLHADVAITANADGTLTWHENVGALASESLFVPSLRHVVSSDVSGATSVAAVDVNGDGTLDVVVAGDSTQWFAGLQQVLYVASDGDDIACRRNALLPNDGGGGSGGAGRRCRTVIAAVTSRVRNNAAVYAVTQLRVSGTSLFADIALGTQATQRSLVIAGVAGTNPTLVCSNQGGCAAVWFVCSIGCVFICEAAYICVDVCVWMFVCVAVGG